LIPCGFLRHLRAINLSVTNAPTQAGAALIALYIVFGEVSTNIWNLTVHFSDQSARKKDITSKGVAQAGTVP